MLSLRESIYLEGAVEQSERNLREILHRLNDLSLGLLPSNPEPAEVEINSQSSSTALASAPWECSIHVDDGKAGETCCGHCEAVDIKRYYKYMRCLKLFVCRIKCLRLYSFHH